MTIKSGFFNSIDGDRKYDAEDINKFFDGVIVDGVLSAIGDIFLVSPSSGLTVAIGSGKAWFLRSWLENTADAFRTLSTADVTFDRIDIIAADFDKSDQVRENDIIVVEGTPSGSPTPPTLIDTATHLQKPLAHILVGANETVIDAGDITIKVDTVDCPFSAGIVELVVEVDNVTIQIVANELSVIDGGISALQIATGAVGSNEIATGAVDTPELAADAVTGAKIGDNVINSEHYVADSIDTEHYAPDSVDNIAIGAGMVGNLEIAADAVTNSKIGAGEIRSEHYGDGSIDREHLAPDIIDGSKIANDAVDSEHIANDAINSEHYAPDSIDSEHYALNSVDSGAIGTGAVGNAQLGPDAVTQAKIQNDAIRSEHYSDGSIDQIHLAADVIDHSKIEDDALRSEHYGFASIDNEHLAANIVDDDNVRNRVPKMPRRQGGNANNWDQQGVNNYTPTDILQQGGSKTTGNIAADASDAIAVTFPNAFSYTPLVFIQVSAVPGVQHDVTALITAISASAFTVSVYNNGPQLQLFDFQWLAIGTA